MVRNFRRLESLFSLTFPNYVLGAAAKWVGGGGIRTPLCRLITFLWWGGAFAVVSARLHAEASATNHLELKAWSHRFVRHFLYTSCIAANERAFEEALFEGKVHTARIFGDLSQSRAVLKGVHTFNTSSVKSLLYIEKKMLIWDDYHYPRQIGKFVFVIVLYYRGIRFFNLIFVIFCRYAEL